MRKRQLSREQLIALAVDRLLAATHERPEIARELETLLAEKPSRDIDRAPWAALEGAARAWLVCGENHPLRPQLKAHLFSARQLARKAAPPMQIAYVGKGGPRPLYEGGGQ